jgi:hypothetical protein
VSRERLTSVDMKITADHFEALRKHLHTPQKDLPPTPVYMLLVSLVNPDDIKASVRSVALEGLTATVWRVHLLTTKTLAVVEVRFEAERYTRAVELQYGHAGTPLPQFKVRQAWVRPLNRIVAYEVGQVPAHRDGDWFPVSATVRFCDLGDPVEIPSQAFGDGDEERERSDEFLRALREAIFW